MQLDNIKLDVSLIPRVALLLQTFMHVGSFLHSEYCVVLNSTGAHVHPKLFLCVLMCMFVWLEWKNLERAGI